MRFRNALHVIQEVMSIRKELREAMIRLFRCLRSRDSGSGTTRRRNAKDRRLGTIRSKDDRAVAVPCAAAALWSVSENLHRSTVNIDPLQFSFREETNGLAIRRPEGKRSAI